MYKYAYMFHVWCIGCSWWAIVYIGETRARTGTAVVQKNYDIVCIVLHEGGEVDKG